MGAFRRYPFNCPARTLSFSRLHYRALITLNDTPLHPVALICLVFEVGACGGPLVLWLHPGAARYSREPFARGWCTFSYT
eukprot:7938817-Pyramimonas_sp.AAC.1